MPLLGTDTNDCIDSVNIATKVFAEYEDFIRAVIRHKVKNEAQADDVFQDFFLSLVSSPPPVNVQNIKSYLYRAIINDIIDAAHRVERYRARMRIYAEGLSYSTNPDNPENALIEKEEINEIFRLVERRLPRSEAKAVILRYKNHCDIKEVAEKMDVNSRSVSRYISSGLSKVRQFFTARLGDYNDCSRL